MERFFGFDLGDAESAVSRLQREGQSVPEELPVAGSRSFVTACAVTAEQGLLLGEQACVAAGVTRRMLRFKRRFLTDASAAQDVRSFAAGVLGELYGSAALVKNEDCCFYIGCPAGWDKNAREAYREIFEQVGYPPARIVSESRAAMVSACQSRHLQVGYDILSRSVLVVDIGSSTTDFAFVLGGHEAEIQTGGEVAFGGGIMDAMFLEESVKASRDAEAIRKVFAESEAWKNYCEFKARRLKERYFSDEPYWREHDCSETIQIRYRRPLLLTLRMDEAMAERLLEGRTELLGGRSFRTAFTDALRQVKAQTQEHAPELVLLTGGVSRMSHVRDWCRAVFTDAVVIAGAQPEFSVSRGLAWCGQIDEELRSFREEIDAFRRSNVVEKIVSDRIGKLYRAVVDAMMGPVVDEVVMPIFDRWRSGDLRRLSDADTALQESLEAWLRSDAGAQKLVEPIGMWLRPVAEELESYTVPICVAHHVPHQALSLRSRLDASDLDIRLEARDLFAVGEITWLIDSIISLLVGLLCGGSGLALISGGPAGVVAGAGASLLLLLLGKERMESALLAADLPVPMRKLTPRAVFRARVESLANDLRGELAEKLEKERNLEISTRLSEEISQQIETCLGKMAEVVEIPLG